MVPILEGELASKESIVNLESTKFTITLSLPSPQKKLTSVILQSLTKNSLKNLMEKTLMVLSNTIPFPICIILITPFR